MSYPETLIEYRKFMGWTQSQMANYLGVNLGSYKNHEHKSTGERDTIVRYARRMHVSTDWMVGAYAVEWWGPEVRRMRRAFRVDSAAQAGQFTLVDDRVTWALRWLLDHDSGRFDRVFLSGLLFLSEETVNVLIDREYGSMTTPPGRTAIMRLSIFIGIPEEEFLHGFVEQLEVDADWLPLISELEAHRISPSDVRDLYRHVLRIGALQTREPS